MPKNTPPSDNDLLRWPVHLLQIVPPDEAARISSASADTLRRNHKDKIVHVSERRRGMRVGHALMIGNTNR